MLSKPRTRLTEVRGGIHQSARSRQSVSHAGKAPSSEGRDRRGRAHFSRLPGTTIRGTANAAEVLYELGSSYYLAGRSSEAAATLRARRRRMAALRLRSRRRLYLVGEHHKAHAAEISTGCSRTAGRWTLRRALERPGVLETRCLLAAPIADGREGYYERAHALFEECLASDTGRHRSRGRLARSMTCGDPFGRSRDAPRAWIPESPR